MVASKQWVVILHRIVLTLPDEVCTPPYSFVSNIPDILHATDRTRLGKSSTEPHSVQLNFACVGPKKLATRTNTIFDCEIQAFPPSPLHYPKFFKNRIDTEEQRCKCKRQSGPCSSHELIPSRSYSAIGG